MGRTYDGTLMKATVDVVNDLLLQPVLPSPAEITNEVLDRCKGDILIYNATAPKGCKWRVPVRLFPFQIAYLVLQFHHVVLLDTETSNWRRNDMMLALYIENGPDTGIYTMSKIEFRRIIRQYNEFIGQNKIKEVMYVLQEEAPKSKLCTDANLVAMNNGIYNKNTKELMPFTSDLVFLEKSDEDYNPNSDEKSCE